ncbi:OR22B protein, partial [Pseudoatta argentina]
MSSSVYSPISYYGGKFTMQSVVLRYYRINKIFISQIGIWPYQSRTQRILIPGTIVLISISVLIAEIICMFDTWGNVNIAVECMISTIIIIGCFTKLFNLILNIKKVINNLDNIENIIRYTALCLATFFHLLCMTLPGQRLMDHSLDVFNSVCRSHWYTFSVKTKKVLRTLLYRSIVPCTLTAGKLYVMSMANYSSYYAINKLFLSGIGVWPYQRRVLKVFLPCLLSTIHYASFVTQVLLVYDTWGNMDIIVEAIIVVTCIFGFRQFLQLMCEHWEFFNSEFERHIMRYYASISQKVTKYFGVYFIVFTIFYLLIPLIPRILDVVKPLNESRPLIYVYSVEYRVDNEKYYYPILLHCYATSLITIIILFTIDTTYIMCVLHVCSLFIAISHRLENITVKAETKSDNNQKYVGRHYHLLMEKYGSTGNDYRELIMCLKRHQLALEHVQILNSTFTQAMFILLSLNMLNMSVIGIQLIKNLEHINEIIRSIFLICAVFIHLVCMCIPGQLLIDRSTEVFDKAYGSAWYTFSIKTRRLLRILLYRSFSPCTLTAGKMFILSMTMCSSVITSNLHI